MRPWELAGFVYEHPAHIPICWREWAFDLARCRAIMRMEQQNQLGALFGR